jgi:hypothetical protein
MPWAECAVCGLAFAADDGFDRHRIFTCAHSPRGHRDECWDEPIRRCLTPAQMRARGWRMNHRRRWTPHPPREAVIGRAVDQRRLEGVALVGTPHPPREAVIGLAVEQRDASRGRPLGPQPGNGRLSLVVDPDISKRPPAFRRQWNSSGPGDEGLSSHRDEGSNPGGGV